jgi:bifunctional enzyme Fae/Hps
VFDLKTRYLQIAFNHDLYSAIRTLRMIPWNERILIEAGTPFIKREGMGGIRALKGMWPGKIVADLKVTDGALGEVRMVYAAGADAATVLGNAPPETLNLFIKECNDLGIEPMIDMLGVKDPLHVMRHLKVPPRVVILHKGRDEEGTRGKVIEYKHVKRIKSKFDVLISAAGGIDLNQARSAIFNGASIVVANIVNPEDPWTGIATDEDVGKMARQFLETIE